MFARPPGELVDLYSRDAVADASEAVVQFALKLEAVDPSPRPE